MPQIGGLEGISETLVMRVQMGCDPSALRAISCVAVGARMRDRALIDWGAKWG